MSPRKPRPLAPVDVSALEDYLTVQDMADLMGVEPSTAASYARNYASFPKPAFQGRRVWGRAAIQDYLARRPRLLGRAGPGAQVDEHGGLLPGVRLPEYLTRTEIAALLDVQPRHVSDAAYADPSFPRPAFGEATVLYATEDVLRFLRRREHGTTWHYDESVLDPQLELLTLSQIAMLVGVTDQSIRAIRFQRHRDVFPSPAIDTETGRPHRPVLFARRDVQRYVELVNAELAERGRRSPTELSLAFLAGA